MNRFLPESAGKTTGTRPAGIRPRLRAATLALTALTAAAVAGRLLRPRRATARSCRQRHRRVHTSAGRPRLAGREHGRRRHLRP